MGACNDPRALGIFKKRAIEAIRALVACVPEAAGITGLVNRINGCTTLDEAQSVFNLAVQTVLCWIISGGVLSCTKPDQCDCYTVNYPDPSGSIDIFDPFLKCVTVPDTTVISGHLTTSAAGIYDQKGGNMPFFTGLTFEKLVEVVTFVYVAFQEELITFSAPELTTVGQGFQVGSNANLRVHDIPKITTVGGDFVTSGTLAPSLFVPLLNTVGGILMSIGGLALADVDISGLTNFDGDFEAVNAALTVESVNHILVILDSQVVLSGARNLLLDSGSSAAPTGAGITAKNNLLGRGVNVVTN